LIFLVSVFRISKRMQKSFDRVCHTKIYLPMKKCYGILVLFFCFGLFVPTAQAQFEEGDRFINTQMTGLDIAKWDFSLEGDPESSDYTQFGLNLSGGQYIQDDLAVVVTLGYLSVSPDHGDGLSSLSLTGGVRYHFGSNFFGGAGLSLNSIKLDDNGATNEMKAYMFGLDGGYSYFFTDRLALEPGVSYAIKFAGEISADIDDDISLKTEPQSDSMDFDLSRMGLTLGITFYF